MTSLTTTIIIIGTETPRTGIEHFVTVGITDIRVENLLRQPTVQQEELRIMVVTTEQGGRLGIEIGILDHQFPILVTSSVMPDDGTAVTHEMTTHSKTPATWTEKIDTRASHVAIDDDSTGGFAEDRHLMRCVARLYHRTIVIINGQSTDDTVVGAIL